MNHGEILQAIADILGYNITNFYYYKNDEINKPDEINEVYYCRLFEEFVFGVIFFNKQADTNNRYIIQKALNYGKKEHNQTKYFLLIDPSEDATSIRREVFNLTTAFDTTKSLEDGNIKEWKKALHINSLKETIFDINKKCFQFLSSGIPAAIGKPFYRLNTNKKLLAAGIYFLSNTVNQKKANNISSVLLSFWLGDNKSIKLPYIYLEIGVDGIMNLHFTTNKHEGRIAFFENLATVLGLQKEINSADGIIHWKKEYFRHHQLSYINEVRQFVFKTRKIIDAFLLASKQLNQDLGDLKFITESEFNPAYDLVLEHYRAAVKKEELLFLEKKITRFGLKKLTLKNIGLFPTLEVNLNKRIVCILGENGTGKTSILRAIALGLVGMRTVKLSDANRKTMERMLKIEGITTKDVAIQYASEGKIVLDYVGIDSSKGTFMDYTNEILFSFNQNTNKITIEDAPMFHENSFGFTDEKGFKYLLIGFAQMQGIIDKPKEENIKASRRGNLNDISPLLYNTEDDRLSSIKKWIYQIANDVNSHKYCRAGLDYLFEIISEIIGVKITFVIALKEEDLIWVRINEDAPVLFDLISQGFKSVFSWVGYFVKRLIELDHDIENFYKHPAIVLIDEIDTYLHPKWQGAILNTLVKYFPNTQFIVTTHSPFVANYLKNAKDDCLLLRIDKGASEATEFKQAYGKNLNDAFLTWFEMPQYIGEIQRQINTIFDLIDEETPESLAEATTLFNKLRGFMSADDETMLQIELSLNMAKINLNSNEEEV